MLTATLGMATAVGGASPRARAASTTEALFGIEARFDTESPERVADVSLVRLHPATLKESGRLLLGRQNGFLQLPWARSPDRRRLVIDLPTDTLQFVDTRALKPVAALQLRTAALFWPTPGVVVAYRPKGDERFELTRIDPVSGRVLDQRIVRGHAVSIAQTARGIAILTSSCWCVGVPLRLVRLGAAGAHRSVALGYLRTALEPWRARRGAMLPPLANEAVRRARVALAKQQHVEPAEADLLFIEPRTPPFEWRGYALAFEVEGRFFYVLAQIGGIYCCGPPRLSGPFETPTRPEASASDLLRVTPGTWEVSDIELVVDPQRDQAVAVTTSSVAAQLDLRTLRLRYRQLRGGNPEGFFDGPVSLGRGLVAFSTLDSVRLLDLHWGTVRTLRAAQRCQLDRGAGTLITSSADGSNCVFAAYHHDGALSFRALKGRALLDVRTAGRYAYASLWSRTNPYDVNPKWAIVDLASKRVVGTKRLPNRTVLLSDS